MDANRLTRRCAQDDPTRRGNLLWLGCLSLSVLLLVFLTLTRGTHAAAPPQAAPNATSSTTSPGAFSAQVDLRYSRAYVHVYKSGVLGHEHAVEGRLKSGTLELGAAQKAGELVFDMSTFTADSEAARRALRLEGDTDAETQKKVDANMRGADILDVERFPTATYTVETAALYSPATADKPAVYELKGTFTLHGVSHPLAVLAPAQETRGYLRVWCQFAILQSEYGIEPYTVALGAIGVADRLEIWGDLWLRPVTTAARR